MHQSPKDQTNCTVAVVGGGVAGLFLANALEQAGISYVVWEAAKTIAPAAGASIGLLPTGFRLLDQIGVIEEVEKYIVPQREWEHRDGETGKLLTTKDTLARYPSELGYGCVFLARQHFLQMLYDNVKDKSKIHASKRAISVQSFDDHALVTAADGSTLRCQLVAGSDGVRSCVRPAIEASIGSPMVNGEDYLSTKFSCVYGISNPLPLMPAGMAYSIYRKGSTFLLFTGLDGVIFWFAFRDLGESIKFEDVPRYTETYLEAICNELQDVVVTEGVSFGDVFRNRTTAIVTPLEEGVVKEWFAERMVLLGDSAHKMVPHAAMGGNLAMESAASLMNVLIDIKSQSNGSLEEIPLANLTEGLRRYAANRKARAQSVVDIAGRACRSQLRQGPDAEAFVQNLDRSTSEQWLGRNLSTFSDADRINDWDGGSQRVEYYTRRAQQIKANRKAASVPQPIAKSLLKQMAVATSEVVGMV